MTEYTLSGKLVVHVNHRNTDLHFWYAGGTKPVVATYNGHDYGYVYNLQGDVIALADLEAEGTQEVVRYAYDAWGKPLLCEGTLAETLGRENPFRYRGYVYDEETGLYYLRTRYYNPEWGRFLSMDSVLGTMGELREHNLFMYCGNNPVDRVDEDGNAWAAVNDGGGSGPKTSSSSGSGWNGAEWWYYEQTGKDPRKPSGSSSSSGSVSYVQNGPVETDKVYRYEKVVTVETQTDTGGRKTVEAVVYTGIDGTYYSFLGKMVSEKEFRMNYLAQPDPMTTIVPPGVTPTPTASAQRDPAPGYYVAWDGNTYPLHIVVPPEGSQGKAVSLAEIIGEIGQQLTNLIDPMLKTMGALKGSVSLGVGLGGSIKAGDAELGAALKMDLAGVSIDDGRIQTSDPQFYAGVETTYGPFGYETSFKGTYPARQRSSAPSFEAELTVEPYSPITIVGGGLYFGFGGEFELTFDTMQFMEGIMELWEVLSGQ